MNLPNKLTVLRVCMVPVFVVFMLWNGFGTASKYVAAAIFILASMTDWLDIWRERTTLSRILENLWIRSRTSCWFAQH